MCMCNASVAEENENDRNEFKPKLITLDLLTLVGFSIFFCGFAVSNNVFHS